MKEEKEKLFVARAKCGCVHAIWTDDPSNAKQEAYWNANGYTIERQEAGTGNLDSNCIHAEVANVREFISRCGNDAKLIQDIDRIRMRFEGLAQMYVNLQERIKDYEREEEEEQDGDVVWNEAAKEAGWEGGQR